MNPLLILFATTISSTCQLKNHIALVFTSFDESRLSRMYNMKKKTDKHPLNTISIVHFLQTRMFTGKFSRTTTIHPGIFRGRALRGDIRDLQIGLPVLD